MKYKFESWQYIMAEGISINWAKEQGLEFIHGPKNNKYAILDELQALRVRFQDPNVTLFPILDDEDEV